MADSAALKAAYQTEVDKISDTLDNARANYQLARFIDALDAQNALETGSIQSYSIAGRSVTKANLSEGRQMVGELEAQLYELIYGSAILLDLNTGVAEP